MSKIRNDVYLFSLTVSQTLGLTRPSRITALARFFSRRRSIALDQKYVLITGCDSGFGRETAIRLDKMGAYVLATCLTEEGEKSLRSATSDKLKTFRLDVTNSEQIKDLYEDIQRLLPSDQGVWGLVNNAGIAITGPIEWIPLQKSKRVANVNLWGMIDVTKTFLSLVKKSRGRVVNMSSMLGRVSLPHVSSYCITKYGVQAFSDALRREMNPWGILVSIIEPGLFKTALAHTERNIQATQDLWDDLSPELKEEYGERKLNQIKKGIIKVSESANPDTYKVVDAVIDALTSQRPKTRYAVGLDAKVSIFISFMPTFIADSFFRRRK
ncbi:retinol dehydrogenase 7-like [Stylophora pistillata]|uniref:retinol dehydrogenase 7-like n=1 Tax=Stylophora pistillata TaxID=50429 RepID=UPI000C04B289|nr:retinol dehydrogenase 7-like [Stylophora pistillata]